MHTKYAAKFSEDSGNKPHLPGHYGSTLPDSNQCYTGPLWPRPRHLACSPSCCSWASSTFTEPPAGMMFKAAGACAPRLRAGLVTIIIFGGGCPDAHGIDSGDTANAESVNAAHVAAASGRKRTHTRQAPNGWCAANQPGGSRDLSNTHDEYPHWSDDKKVTETQGTGTAFIICIVGFVFELITCVFCFVLVKPGGGAVKPATGLAP